ncbi:alanine racemase [Priestia megaterium]
MELHPFYRDTWVEINLSALENNLINLTEHLPNETKIIAVVKANAYGHGYVPIAKAALKAGASMLAVAFLDEAIYIRKSGITKPILVMGPTRPADLITAQEWDITLTAISLEWIQKASEISLTKTVNIHMKIDSGMGRIGLKNSDEINQSLALISSAKHLKLEGVFTHFATADEIDTSYFNKQYKTFTKLLRLIPDGLIIHIANSATSLRFPEKCFNAVRFGISMYGLLPSQEIKSDLPFELKECFSLHSVIAHVKKVDRNEGIGYGAAYMAEGGEWIATIPIGYADGWIRKLHSTSVLVDGKAAPIIGRICMDQLMILLPEYKEVGTKVTFIGTQKNEEISVDEVAKLLGTINYEVPCMISWRVPRIYTKNNKIVEVSNSLNIS